MKLLTRAALVLLVLTVPTLSNHADGGHFTFEPADKLFTWAAAWLEHMPLGSLAHNTSYMQSQLPDGFTDFFLTVGLFFAVPIGIAAWLQMVSGMRKSIMPANIITQNVIATGVSWLVMLQLFELSNDMQGPITASNPNMLRGMSLTLVILELLIYLAGLARQRWST
jgi:hypothetical protein